MYRKIGQENETEEDSVTNLGGQEKEWVLGNEGANSDGFCLDETRKVGVLLDDRTPVRACRSGFEPVFVEAG